MLGLLFVDEVQTFGFNQTVNEEPSCTSPVALSALKMKHKSNAHTRSP